MLRYDEKQLYKIRKSAIAEAIETHREPMENDLRSHSESEAGVKTEKFLEGEETAQVEDYSEKRQVEGFRRIPWWMVDKYYERSKQYIFVAATLPVNSSKTAGGILIKKFPDASWTSGNFLHRHSPRCILNSCYYLFDIINFPCPSYYD